MIKLDTSSELAGQIFECHGGSVTAAAFGPRLTWAVSGGWDGHLLKWEPATGCSTERWVASARPITALAVSQDGTMLLSGDMDGRVCMWDSLTRQLQKEATVHTRPVGGLAISGNGRAYASCGWDAAVHVWYKPDEEQPSIEHVLRGHQDIVSGCKFWPDGRWLLTWSYDGTAVLWELSRGVPYQTWSTSGHRVVAADIAPDATQFALATLDGTVLVWNLHDSHHPPLRWDSGGPLKALFFAPNAQELVLVGTKGLVQCVNVPNFFATCPAKELGYEVQAAALAPAGECLAVGGDEGTLQFIPLPHLEKCEVILTPLERIEEHTETGLWGKITKRTKLLRMRRAGCPKCGRILEVVGDEAMKPQPCPGCQRALAFTPFTLAG